MSETTSLKKQIFQQKSDHKEKIIDNPTIVSEYTSLKQKRKRNTDITSKKENKNRTSFSIEDLIVDNGDSQNKRKSNKKEEIFQIPLKVFESPN